MDATLVGKFTVGGSVYGGEKVISGAAAILDGEDIAAETTDKEFLWALDVGQAQAILLYSTTAVTLKTNSSSAPDDTVALPAGEPVVWSANGPLACPFSVDVTKLYASAVAAAKLTAIGIYDPTP